MLFSAGLTLFLSLCLVLTLSAVGYDGKLEINETVYIKKGAISTQLSCGNVHESVVAMEWFIYKDDQWEKIMKFYKNWGKCYYYNNVSENNYEGMNTSLLIKNIKLSDAVLFKCNSIGGLYMNTYTTKVQVVGKFSLKYLLTVFTLI